MTPEIKKYNTQFERLSKAINLFVKNTDLLKMRPQKIRWTRKPGGEARLSVMVKDI